MPSYYIDTRAQPDGSHVIHARDPGSHWCCPREAEYLGELLDAVQALTLARLNYRRVQGCACCDDYAGALVLEAHESGASYVGSSRTARILAAACMSTSSTPSSPSSSWLAPGPAGGAASSIPLSTC